MTGDLEQTGQSREREREMTEMCFRRLDGEKAVVRARRVTDFKRKTVNWEITEFSESS